MISAELIYSFLLEVQDDFVPRLWERVNIREYANKLASNAVNLYTEEEDIIGMACFYANQPPDAFLSLIVIKNEYKRKGHFKDLFHRVIQYLKENNFSTLRLEVSRDNLVAYKAYKKLGFEFEKDSDLTNHDILFMGI